MSVASATVGRRPASSDQAEERKVIFASSVGTVFEWYDFYLAGALAREHRRHVLLGRQRDGGLHLRPARLRRGLRGPSVRRAVVRPPGRSRRPQVHLPRHHDRSWASRPSSSACCRAMPAIGLLAPVLFIVCRLVQGLALGGEYGGAATYVAEHAPHGRRGYLHVLDPDHGDPGPVPVAARHPGAAACSMTPRQFAEWGWRVPFLLSIILLGFSIWIRLQLQRVAGLPQHEGRGQGLEGAADRGFRQLEQRQDRAARAARRHRRPGAWCGTRGQFYALFFLTQTLKLDGTASNIADRRLAADRHAVLHLLRLAVATRSAASRSSWPAACSPPSPTSRCSRRSPTR